MENTRNRAVCITGMAWTSGFGTSLEDVWLQVLAAETALTNVPSVFPLRNMVAACVAIGAGERPSDRQHELSLMTLREAIRNADLLGSERGLQLVLGTSLGAHIDELAVESLGAWADRLAVAVGSRVKPFSVSTACSSGSDAILVGHALIEAGAAEQCICGGSDVLTAAKRLGHSALRTMSSLTMRPFDENRDGMLLGEGAAFLVLESRKSAAKRGARIYGYVLGGGSSNDAGGQTAPDASGGVISLALTRALRHARIEPDDVALINAHGTGTTLNDAAESRGIFQVFEKSKRAPIVFATKPAFGHTLGATGAIEAIAVLLAVRSGTIPPILGLVDVPADFKLRFAIGKTERTEGSIGLSVTLGFGGFNSCIALEGVCE